MNVLPVFSDGLKWKCKHHDEIHEPEHDYLGRHDYLEPWSSSLGKYTKTNIRYVTSPSKSDITGVRNLVWKCVICLIGYMHCQSKSMYCKTRMLQNNKSHLIRYNYQKVVGPGRPSISMSCLVWWYSFLTHGLDLSCQASSQHSWLLVIQVLQWTFNSPNLKWKCNKNINTMMKSETSTCTWSFG